jgi:hypothetical protein
MLSAMAVPDVMVTMVARQASAMSFFMVDSSVRFVQFIEVAVEMLVLRKSPSVTPLFWQTSVMGQ